MNKFVLLALIAAVAVSEAVPRWPRRSSSYKPAYSPPAEYAPPSYKAPEYAAPAYKAPEYAPPAYKAPAYSKPAYTDDYAKPAYTDDYAKPSYDYSPMPYKFDYAVKDEYSYNDYAHQQESDGKVVTGSYRVLLPDGRTQIVTYKADEYGYVADVKYEGEAKPYEYTKPAAYPSYSKPAYEPEPYAKPAAYPKPAAYEPEPYYPEPAPYKAPEYKPAYPKY